MSQNNLALIALAGLISASSAAPSDYAPSRGMVPTRADTSVLTRGRQGNDHEPPGFITLSDRHFDSLIEGGWNTRRDRRFELVSEPSAPQSPPSVGRAIYPAGFEGGRGPINTALAVEGKYRALYVSFWVRLSPNWIGHRSGVNKILHIHIDGRNKVYLSAQGQGAGHLQPQVRLQGVAEKPVSRNLHTNMGRANLQRGLWHHWEVLLYCNDAGLDNGQAQWWVDGRLVGAYANIRYVPFNGDHFWTKVAWNPTWGGVGQRIVVPQYMDIDNLYVSVGNPL